MNRKSIIRTHNKSNDKTYLGLVVNIDEEFVTAIKLSNNSRIAKNESLAITVNGEEYFANVFSSPFTVKENTIEGIVGEVSDIQYFNIISSIINVYMGFWHIDEDGCQILDTIYVKNPIATMLFGANTIGFFNESILNEGAKNEEKIRRRNEISFKRHLAGVRQLSRTMKKSDVITALEKENVFSLPTQNRVDMIFRMFGAYVYHDKLDVSMVHKVMFFDTEYHTTRMQIRLNREEFMFVINSSTDEIATKYNKNKAQATSIRRRVMDVFHGKRMPKHIVLDDSIIEQIKSLRASGKRFREVFEQIQNEYSNVFIGYSYQSILKAVKNAFSNTNKATYHPVEKEVDINKQVDRLLHSEWFSQSTYKDDIRNLIIANINDPEVIDGSKTINHPSPYVRCMVLVALYSNYNITMWPEFLLKPINRDLVDWLNSIDYKEFCDIGYEGVTNVISSSNKIGYKVMKIVAHYLTISDEEKEKLSASLVSGKLEDIIYPLCGSFGTSGKFHSWLFEFISNQTGIDMKAFQDACDRKKYIHMLHIK